ncbi:MAG: hypothetical protein ACC628_27260, partial [Pirellulaceae bacterium]
MEEKAKRAKRKKGGDTHKKERRGPSLSVWDLISVDVGTNQISTIVTPQFVGVPFATDTADTRLDLPAPLGTISFD